MRRLLVGWVAGAVCLTAFAACPAWEWPASGPPNLLLISLDTLRADHLGSYGYERDTSPFLDRLASEGVLFEHAMSTSSWTIPAHVSIFTGLYPSRHTVRGFKPYQPGIPSLPGLLAERGYATASVLNLTALRTVNRGFHDRRMVEPHGEGGAGTDEVSEESRKWLETAASPWFLFAHFYQVHSDYMPGPEYAERFVRPYEGIATGETWQLRRVRMGQIELGPEDARHLVDLYDAEIRQLDEALEEFFSFLEDAGHLDNTLVVIVSDHGEEFLEHGSVLHGRTLHQELVRVPFILWGAGIPEGRRVSQPVSLVDVLPTALSLLGVDASLDVDGVDLAGSWDGSPPPQRPIFAETDSWIGNSDRNFRRAVRQGHWTLHYDGASGTRALYDLRSDAGETQDRSALHPEVASSLWKWLAPSVPDEPPEVTPPPEDLIEELRALGYVGEEDEP